MRFRQGSAGLEAALRHRNGAEESIRPSYLIGVDGAHSTVRHGLDIEFIGKTFEQAFLLADLHVDTEWPDDEFHIFASGEGIATLFPMGGGRARLIADKRATSGATANDAAKSSEEIAAPRSTIAARLSSVAFIIV